VFSKTELAKNFGVRFTEILYSEVEISIPDWRTPRLRNLIRVTLVNDGSLFTVATPGKGGSFRLSYQYQFHFPAENFGFKSIEAALRNVHYGMHEFRATETMMRITVSALNEARKMLRKANR